MTWSLVAPPESEVVESLESARDAGLVQVRRTLSDAADRRRAAVAPRPPSARASHAGSRRRSTILDKDVQGCLLHMRALSIRLRKTLAARCDRRGLHAGACTSRVGARIHDYLVLLTSSTRLTFWAEESGSVR